MMNLQDGIASGQPADARRRRDLVKALLLSIHRQLASISSPQKIRLMEVCGTHTMSIFKHGLRHLLPDRIELISGPGCPVCVTSPGQIDAAIKLSDIPDLIVATFGDMLRVPGSQGQSLAKARARGADVRIVYSPVDALQLARDNPDRNVCFLGIGFETTAPVVAATLKMASQLSVNNFFVYSCHKTMPNALEALFSSKESDVQGLLCPGHVSAIIGEQPYGFLVEKYGLACAITGFEAEEILLGVLSLLKQLASKYPFVDNCYPRAVSPEGNPSAVAALEQVFQPSTAVWRGLGSIPGSGLAIRQQFKRHDAESHFGIEIEEPNKVSGCRCHRIITGQIIPPECPMFRKACTPENPMGPCMVSSEGACAAWFKYGGERL